MFESDFNQVLNASRGDLQAAGLNQEQIEQVLNPSRDLVDRNSPGPSTPTIILFVSTTMTTPLC